MARTPLYNTVTFNDIYPEHSLFVDEVKDSGLNKMNEDETLTTLYYLLYARYGNSPIANYDINQWKYKMFSVIYQYGPTWEKRLDIQEKLRALTDEELMTGSIQISNHAFNPDTAPTTQTTEELDYINEQNVGKVKRSKLDAYTRLWELLKVDVTENFLNEFKKCFKVFVEPENPLLYGYEEEE